MQANGRILGSAICALAVAALSATAFGQKSGGWSDNFDSYAAGVGLATQSRWETWDNIPAGDSLVNNFLSRTAPNSVAIGGDSDTVMVMDCVTAGKWTVTLYQFLPRDMTGETWLVWLNSYVHNRTYNWSGQVEFDPVAGNLTWLGRDPGVTLPLVMDEWIEIIIEIDFDTDVQEVFYDGVLLVTRSWKDGVSGGGLAQFQCLDLFGNGSSDIYYDDVSVEIFGGGGGGLFCGQIVCPPDGGTAELTLTGGTANGPVGIVASTNGSGFTIPIGGCAGTVIATKPPFIVGPINTSFDGSGDLTMSKNVPAGLCGVISVSAVDLTTCDVVNFGP